jgi:hypothetical protein
MDWPVDTKVAGWIVDCLLLQTDERVNEDDDPLLQGQPPCSRRWQPCMCICLRRNIVRANAIQCLRVRFLFIACVVVCSG